VQGVESTSERDAGHRAIWVYKLQSPVEEEPNGKYIWSGWLFEEGTGQSTAGSPTLHCCACGFGKLKLERAAHFVGIGSQTHQPRAEKAMGEDPKGIAASSENNWFDTCKAHYVGLSPPKDRSDKAGAVGEGEGGSEEGGVAVLVASPALFQVECWTSRQKLRTHSVAIWRWLVRFEP
jgi:hypothetical protein